MKPRLSTLPDDELIMRFASEAKRMGMAILDSETRKANSSYDVMREINLVLRSRGVESRLKLLPLLRDQDRFVRYYAAKKLLGLVPDQARAELEWNHKYRFDALAGDAGMTLRHLDTGFYRPE